MTVTNKPDRRGEHEISRKTVARGMPGDPGVTVVTMLVCFFHLHARLRVHWASGIPCALCFSKGRRRIHAKPGRPRAARMRSCIDELCRHPREGGDPVFQRRLRINREAAAYWIVRSSRTMTSSLWRATSPPWLDERRRKRRSNPDLVIPGRFALWHFGNLHCHVRRRIVVAADGGGAQQLE
jgi:hypothetical protein